MLHHSIWQVRIDSSKEPATSTEVPTKSRYQEGHTSVNFVKTDLHRLMNKHWSLNPPASHAQKQMVSAITP